jgi:hypothetical protein
MNLIERCGDAYTGIGAVLSLSAALSTSTRAWIFSVRAGFGVTGWSVAFVTGGQKRDMTDGKWCQAKVKIFLTRLKF